MPNDIEKIENEISVFDYSDIDDDKVDELKRLEKDIDVTQAQAVYRLGEDFKSVRNLMAHNRKGNGFVKWYQHRGYSGDSVERSIRYYDFISANCGNSATLQSLPKSLIYEASKKSTPQELKDGVANGSIVTLAEFRKVKEQLEMARAENKALKANPQAAGDETEQLKAELEAAKKERDKFKKDAYGEREARLMMESLKKSAVEERDDAKAELDSLRETVRRQADELSERPRVEVEKRVEVVPEDYDFIKKANAGLHRRIAELEAHAKGMSLQELAEKDEHRKQYMKTLEEETEAAQQVRKVFGDIICLPDDEAEMRELARCYLDWSARKNETLEDARRTLQEAQAKLNILAEQFGVGVTLKVVK